MLTTATLAAHTDAVSTHPKERLAWLAECIRHAAHYLPAQGPITAFIHHNTLHAFEHLDFEQGVVAGAELFGCHPFLREEDYRERMARGRITHDDIEVVLIEDLGDRGDELLGFLGTRFALRRNMLAHPLRTGTAAELRWVIAETEALRQFREETPPEIREATIAHTRQWVMRDLYPEGSSSPENQQARELLERLLQRFASRRVERWTDPQWEALTLHMLWAICREGVGHTQPPTPVGPPLRRHRDLAFEATGQDTDQMVSELLLRYCAAFFDQGFAQWTLPLEEGFFATFSILYRQPFSPPDRWRRGLAKELTRIADAGLTPVEVIWESMSQLGLAEEEIEPYLLQSLLALRGYAGMIWQLETRGDRAARPVPEGTLVEYVAVWLLLERLALQHVAAESIGYRGPLAELRQQLEAAPVDHSPSIQQRAFLVFQLAQLEGWAPETMYRLRPREWRWVVREIEAFSRLERRRIYHLAFERRYRMQALDAIVAHRRRLGAEATATTTSRPSFQIACCLDEREESFRRHLEEVAPACRTYGVAGFFSVAMYYRGAADAHFTPLCPIIVRPRHYVAESVVAALADTDRRRRRHRRAIGTVTRRVHLGSRTFAGGWVAGVLGSIASLPLVMRVFFPRATSRVCDWAAKAVQTPSLTRLKLKRAPEVEPGPEGGQLGYHPDEMATIVEQLLRDIGIAHNLSRLVIVCGHGSSSLNNPHESAYDCGACGGNPGGPNARAFAQMANDPEVRSLVAARGIAIPHDTVFVGSYHNTCDDSMTYYDLELLPPSHWAEMERVKEQIEQARARNAHERCRRFESAQTTWSPRRALQHVEGRAEDLSQARPECGHATNVLCLVGRREWSRGLYMDRRAFLQSYDPSQDDEQYTILTRILQAVIPVCVGINLEYYFSYVDPNGYGSGTKLPHNIASLLGVMNGAASDLRTGLPWQMVEIHEPMRQLMVVETTPQAMLAIMAANPGIDRLIRGGWTQLATFDPETNHIQLFRHGEFQSYRPRSTQLPVVGSSIAWYRGLREHLGFAIVEAEPVTKELK